jgi:F-type H+-transporting ATPase subunit delta
VTSATQGSTGLAERYAAALFELAEADNALDAVAAELQQLQVMVDGSPDLERLIRSPVISREDQQRAMQTILTQAGASALTQRFVGVVAQNRRLFALPSIIVAFAQRLAKRRGETMAEVASAKPLSEKQLAAIAAAVKTAVGANAVLTTRVDPSLLGGLVVKVGSRMVDSSLKTKLLRLSFAIKGIG